jgi:hypothetical protein
MGKKQMGKKRCKKEDYQIPNNLGYICKKCDRGAKKEDQVCEPKKIKKKPELG